MMKTDKTVEYLNLGPAEIERQERLRESKLQSIEPVALPEDYGGIFASNSHLGWPIAAAAGENLIVLFSGMRVRGETDRAIYTVFSEDGGETWSPPCDLTKIIEYPSAGGPNMRALGAASGGKAVAITCRGVFSSSDKGGTWKHLDSRGLPEGNGCNVGPRIIEHPEYGLTAALSIRENKGAKLSLFASRDEGMSWHELKTACDSSHSLSPSEPTIFSLEDDFAVVSRNFAGHSAGLERDFKSWNYFAQFTPLNAGAPRRGGEICFKGCLTNIFARRMDTMDVIYNPVSKRVEAVTPKRNEGFPYRDNGYQTLNLWSISPEKFSRGCSDWRFECTLLRSTGTFSKSWLHAFPPREGLHPGGSVIDEKRGMQHIFIFCGNRNHRRPETGRTGIFRISRRLETDLVRQSARSLDNYDRISEVDEKFENLDGWTLSGRPVGLQLTGENDRDIHAWNDIVHRSVEPLPNGEVRADGEGLHIRTKEPGYYGLHNEKTIVLQNYRLDVEAKIERCAGKGDSLGINVNYGSQRQYLILRKDGLYHLEGKGRSPARIKELGMDRRWHVWSLEMAGGTAKIYMDGKHIADSPALFDDNLGGCDTPLSIYSRTKDASDFAEVRIKRLKLKNIEES